MLKLLQFTVGNFRSFNNKRTFTFVPTAIKDEPQESVANDKGYRYSTISAVYGANSSGKSNLADAMSCMKHLILTSVKLNDDDELLYDPFQFTDHTRNEPMFFETVYLNHCWQRIRYGFESNRTHIIREWLFVKDTAKGDEIPYFVRDEDGIAVNETVFTEGVDNEAKTNDNRLFLSLVAQLGGDFSKHVMMFFRGGCNVVSGIDNWGYAPYTKRKFLEHDEICDEAMRFFRHLKLGFTDIEVEEQDSQDDKKDDSPKKLEVYSLHNMYADNGSIVGQRRFKFSKMESQGTKKVFELAGPIFDTLQRGAVLIVDELDAKMHPLMSQQIVRLFTSDKTNPKHAQLMFTTHDTNLLASRLMRRDQIWFTEKDGIESTDLYRLTDIVLPDGSKPRGDGNLERNYIRGRYGAIPYINFED